MSERIILSNEELEALRSILTKERPLCWYCEACPKQRQRENEYCRRQEIWRDAVKNGKCRGFRLAEGRLAGPKECTAQRPHVEQLGLDFSGGRKASPFGEDEA